jgi:hypothetical protein
VDGGLQLQLWRMFMRDGFDIIISKMRKELVARHRHQCPKVSASNPFGIPFTLRASAWWTATALLLKKI